MSAELNPDVIAARVKGPHAFLTLTLYVPITEGEAEREAERYPVGEWVLIHSIADCGDAEMVRDRLVTPGFAGLVEACVPNERTGYEPDRPVP